MWKDKKWRYYLSAMRYWREVNNEVEEEEEAEEEEKEVEELLEIKEEEVERQREG